MSVHGQQHDEVRNDLDEDALNHQFLTPYRTGEPVTVNGKTIAWDNVDRVRISTSDVPTASIIEQIRAADRNSRVVHLGGPSLGWRAAARASDVTDQLITGPPGSAQQRVGATLSEAGVQSVLASGSEAPAGDSAAVFVVAGRDSRAASAIGALLRALGLRVIEWEHAVAKTGLPNPYVGDVVEAGLRTAGAAVVLLTPDDLVRLREDLLHDEDGEEEREVRGQARPNVYYEAGIADAIGRERTVIVEIGSVKSFSDAAGRHVVRYDGSPSRRQALVERLRLAGLPVDTGGQDWLTAGDVAEVLTSAREAIDTGDEGRASGLTVNKDVLIEQINTITKFHEELLGRSEYDDLSDLPDESLDLTFRAQALIDRFAAQTPYAAETERLRTKDPHVRIPALMSVLRSLRVEAE